MLRNLDPLLSPDLLHALRSMGHGHDIAIVDANFPSDSAQGRVLRIDGASATDVLAAVLTVLPVETDQEAAACRMIAEDDPDKMLPVFLELEAQVAGVVPDLEVAAIDPAEFKQRSNHAYVTVITGERRLYGGIIIRKGVVEPLPD